MAWKTVRLRKGKVPSSRETRTLNRALVPFGTWNLELIYLPVHPLLNHRSVRAVNRIDLRQRQVGNIFVGFGAFAFLAVVHVGLLAGRIRAHHSEVAARAEISVRHTGRDQDDIAR